MTRNQAYIKMCETQSGKKIGAYDIAPSVFCDYLEALGLIIFDKEPEKVISVSLNWMKYQFKAEMMKRKYSPDSGSVLDGLDAIIKMFEKKDLT